MNLNVILGIIGLTAVIAVLILVGMTIREIIINGRKRNKVWEIMIVMFLGGVGILLIALTVGETKSGITKQKKEQITVCSYRIENKEDNNQDFITN
jgi:RsiW-degrading membrane proteinase PrsW (M82 family)